MKSKTNYGKQAMLFGGITLFLFLGKPYILDFIEPIKTIGQVYGEGIQDGLEKLNSNQNTSPSRGLVNPERENLSLVISIFSISFLVLTIILLFKFIMERRKST